MTDPLAERLLRRNTWAFGLGTVGRDMVYGLVSMFMIFYLSEVIQLPNSTMWWLTGVILATRILDAFLDPLMGTVIDNSHTRWGQYKPWILIGGLAAATLTVILFTDFGLRGAPYLVLFFVAFLAWGASWAVNDIAYWSMLPALSLDPRHRERLGSFARICASVGSFTLVAMLVPASKALERVTGSMTTAYQWIAIAVVAIMLAGMVVTLLGVREPGTIIRDNDRTTLRDMRRVIARNDQLMWIGLGMLLFMTGYLITTSFSLYYFKYALKNESMYPVFALMMGATQILSLAAFPRMVARVSRERLYGASTAVILVAYVSFSLVPANMWTVALCAIPLFSAQAFVQMLILVFLADTIEYGQWTFGRRNGGVTFAVQPFINKVSSAVATGIVGATIILAGINRAETPDDVSAGGLQLLRLSMLILPMILIVLAYVIWRLKYTITPERHEAILAELRERGQLRSEETVGPTHGEKQA
ncbi:MAG TPA: glycoside-pentoside-hexuronide (GPH):cation symporter [Propionibacteriaceae bacterium]|nr:glycoside-pentoside-hexuronide (GPH):cation symporter [Propionibacteriaceae bacterium]